MEHLGGSGSAGGMHLDFLCAWAPGLGVTVHEGQSHNAHLWMLHLAC